MYQTIIYVLMSMIVMLVIMVFLIYKELNRVKERMNNINTNLMDEQMRIRMAIKYPIITRQYGDDWIKRGEKYARDTKGDR